MLSTSSPNNNNPIKNNPNKSPISLKPIHNKPIKLALLTLRVYLPPPLSLPSFSSPELFPCSQFDVRIPQSPLSSKNSESRRRTKSVLPAENKELFQMAVAQCSFYGAGGHFGFSAPKETEATARLRKSKKKKRFSIHSAVLRRYGNSWRRPAKLMRA